MNVRIPADLEERLKTAAALVGASSAQFVRAAIEKMIEEPDARAITAQEEPRVAEDIRRERIAARARELLEG